MPCLQVGLGDVKGKAVLRAGQRQLRLAAFGETCLRAGCAHTKASKNWTAAGPPCILSHLSSLSHDSSICPRPLRQSPNILVLSTPLFLFKKPKNKPREVSLHTGRRGALGKLCSLREIDCRGGPGVQCRGGIQPQSCETKEPASGPLKSDVYIWFVGQTHPGHLSATLIC